MGSGNVKKLFFVTVVLIMTLFSSYLFNGSCLAFHDFMLSVLRAPSAARYVHDITKEQAFKNKTLQRQLPRVIVSLTSFSDRLAFIEPTLQSLFEQTYPADVVYLNIPTQGSLRRYSTQSNFNMSLLSSFKDRWPRLRLVETRDFGPATKLLGILHLETNPKTIIITVDDDTQYYKDMLGLLVGTILALPGNRSVGFTCEHYYVNTGGWRWHGTPSTDCSGYIAAYSGAAYRRRYFDERIYDIDKAGRGCLLHDDVYIGGYLRTVQGVKPFLIAYSIPWHGPRSVKKHVQTTKLTVHETARASDLQMECFQFYRYFQ